MARSLAVAASRRRSISTPNSIPNGNLPGWTHVYSEDFTTPAAVGQIEAVYGQGIRGYADGSLDTETKTDATNRGWYYPSKVLSALQGVAGANGILRAWIHTEAIGGTQTHLVAAPTPGPNNLTYARYSVRMRYPSLPNYKAAFLLWPTSEIWGEGEIDYPEGTMSGSMAINHHALGASPGNVPYPMDVDTAPDEWHTYTIEWYPGVVRYFLDDVKMLTATRDVPTVPHRWVLQMETTIGSPSPPPDAQNGNVDVDWVAIHTAVVGYDYSTTELSQFTGTNGAALPAPWTSVRGTNTIQGDRAQQVTSTTQWSTALVRMNTRFTDGYVTATFRLTTSMSQYVGFRYNTASDIGYVVRVNTAGVTIGRWNNATFTTIATAAMTLNAGTDYRVMVQGRAGGLSAKVWAAASSEPAAWTIAETFDFNGLSGDVVLMTQTSLAGTAATGIWDNVTVYTP